MRERTRDIGEGKQDATSLVEEIKNAKSELADAEKATSMARSVECMAMNRYNKACKKLDAFIETMKEGAPHDTDWGVARRGQV